MQAAAYPLRYPAVNNYVATENIAFANHQSFIRIALQLLFNRSFEIARHLSAISKERSHRGDYPNDG